MNLFGEPDMKTKARLKDPAYEIFRAVFNQHRSPARYGLFTADFVQLAKLRKTMELPPLGSPPDWERACLNYVLSPQGSYTLRDLVSRYDVFVHSALDRYGRPIIEHHPHSGSDDSKMYLSLPVKPPDHRPMSHDEVVQLMANAKKKK